MKYLALFLFFFTALVYQSAIAKDWYCLCYKAKVNDKVQSVTSCRVNKESCTTLSQKIFTTTKDSVLIPQSVSQHCTRITALHPGEVLGQHSFWTSSTNKDSFWMNQACLLPYSKTQWKQVKKITEAKQGSQKNSILHKIKKKFPQQDIAIICEKNQIKAYANRKEYLILNHVKSQFCIFDAVASIIWVHQGQSLYILDLLEHKVSLRKIIDSFDRKNQNQESYRYLSVAHEALKVYYGNTHNNQDYALSINLEPFKLELTTGNFSFNYSDEELKVIQAHWVVHDPLFFPELRMRHTINDKILKKYKKQSKKYASCPKKLKGISQDHCQYGTCGSTTAIANSPYCRVMVSQSCGDGCYSSYELYNPQTKKRRRVRYGLERLNVSPSQKYIITQSREIWNWKRKLKSNAVGWIL